MNFYLRYSANLVPGSFDSCEMAIFLFAHSPAKCSNCGRGIPSGYTWIVPSLLDHLPCSSSGNGKGKDYSQSSYLYPAKACGSVPLSSRLPFGPLQRLID